MTEEPPDTSPPITSPQPEAPSKKRPLIRRKGRDRSRELIVILGVLVVALAILNIWSYTTLSSENTNLQSQLASLNTTHQTYVTTHSHNNTEFEDLVEIINLEKSSTLLTLSNFSQPGPQLSSFDFSLDYAGYIIVNINSTRSSAYVIVQYEAFDYFFDETKQIGRSNIVAFPVLPTNEISVSIGSLSLQGAEYDVLITYHY